MNKNPLGLFTLNQCSLFICLKAGCLNPRYLGVRHFVSSWRSCLQPITKVEFCPILTCVFPTDLRSAKKALPGSARSPQGPGCLVTDPSGLGPRCLWLGPRYHEIWMRTLKIWTEISWDWSKSHKVWTKIWQELEEISWDLDWVLTRFFFFFFLCQIPFGDPYGWPYGLSTNHSER